MNSFEYNGKTVYFEYMPYHAGDFYCAPYGDEFEILNRDEFTVEEEKKIEKYFREEILK